MNSTFWSTASAVPRYQSRVFPRLRYGCSRLTALPVSGTRLSSIEPPKIPARLAASMAPPVKAAGAVATVGTGVHLPGLPGGQPNGGPPVAFGAGGGGGGGGGGALVGARGAAAWAPRA